MPSELGDSDSFNQKKKCFATPTQPKRSTNHKGMNPLKKYVFVISNDMFEEGYKVSIVKDIHAGLISYQTSEPSRSYKLGHSFHTDKPREIEKHIRDRKVYSR